MDEAVGVVVTDIAGVALDVDHDDSSVPSFMLSLIQIAINTCSFHVGLCIPVAISNVGSIFGVVADCSWLVAAL